MCIRDSVRLEQEGGLRKVGPVRDCLHLLGAKPIRAGYHRKGVAVKGTGGKNINLKELVLHARQSSQPQG